MRTTSQQPALARRSISRRKFAASTLTISNQTSGASVASCTKCVLWLQPSQVEIWSLWSAKSSVVNTNPSHHVLVTGNLIKFELNFIFNKAGFEPCN